MKTPTDLKNLRNVANADTGFGGPPSSKQRGGVQQQSQQVAAVAAAAAAAAAVSSGQAPPPHDLAYNPTPIQRPQGTPSKHCCRMRIAID